MISIVDLESRIKKGVFDNCYVLCGLDENLIKENIKLILDKNLQKDFIELNYAQFDGEKIDSNSLINSCETMPFMSDKKVVLVYRADFLEDKNDDATFKTIEKYIGNMPPYCILIMYYVFKSERDKPSRKLNSLDKKATVIKVDKLKGEFLKTKVKKLFESKGKNIGRTELTLFCNEVDNNTNIIENEIDKLCSYTEGREITKEDIILMMPQKSENDIFNLVDFISQKRLKQSLDIVNELLFRGSEESHILYMIERQFKLLLDIKLGIENGKGKDALVSSLRLNPYVCEKLMSQSRRFERNKLIIALNECIRTEKRLKTLSIDKKVELEMLIVKTITL